MIVFQVSLNFNPEKEILKIRSTMSDLYFNKESDYSEENVSANEDFPRTEKNVW